MTVQKLSSIMKLGRRNEHSDEQQKSLREQLVLILANQLAGSFLPPSPLNPCLIPLSSLVSCATIKHARTRVNHSRFLSFPHSRVHLLRSYQLFIDMRCHGVVLLSFSAQESINDSPPLALLAVTPDSELSSCNLNIFRI